MTIVRLGGGRLVVHDAIALGPREMERIDAWGTPAFLVVPNAGHRLDAKAYVARYPSATHEEVEHGADARRALERAATYL
ncbi:hypothetical protein [Sandaracinus amylolyticus]|uniref:hypothetical protein n=1 Tax=Sandaracinus amylolyticus TaxID=927083 RepID=UPI001F1A16D4|nr:hypothetical protein [Sandaracinus amylolyticus]